MIQHHPQFRHLVGDLHDRLEQVDPRVGGVQHEIGLSEQPKSVDERGALGLFRDVASPEVAVSDASKEPVLVISGQHFSEVRPRGLEVADHADHDGVPLRDFEHPQVVFHPRTRFDLDRADDAEGRRERAIAWRQRGLRRAGVGMARVGRALGPRRIEQMNMGVDDRDRGGCDLRRGPPRRPCRRRVTS